MTVTVSTDPIQPAERQAFWTEAICKSFANVETRPLRPGAVSGHFEFVRIGDAKLVRFDSSPQRYSRDARLVSLAGSDEFMFDIQMRGRSCVVQGDTEGAIPAGHGVLYDARRPFEDVLDAPDRRAEVLMVTVPAARLLQTFPGAERSCAMPIPLTGAVARAITLLVRAAIRAPDAWDGQAGTDMAAYIAALLRQAHGGPHGLSRASLFPLLDLHVRSNMASAPPPAVLAQQFGIAPRTFHRIFAERGTTFERHALRMRVERLRRLLAQPQLADIPIVRLAQDCGFADAAHATRSFRRAFAMAPRDYRAAALAAGDGAAR
jgi:AraC family transcriptional regulator, positive regulator of tynA and feaB